MIHTIIVARGEPTSVLALENSGVLARSFLFAVLIMAPIAAWQWWRIHNRRARERAAAEARLPRPEPVDVGPTLEVLIAEIGNLATELPAGGTTTIRVEAGITLDGRPADMALLDPLVRDAIARSDLEILDRSEVAGDILLECRRN